jgi:hypothetical protein
MDRPARFAPPQALATAVAAEVRAHAVAGGHATQPNRIRAAKHGNAVMPICRSGLSVSRMAPSCALTTAVRCMRMGPSRQRRCHEIVQHAAVSNAGIRGQAARLFAPASHRHLFPRSLFARLCSFTILPRPVWQAEEAVANLPLRLAVRVHCGCQVGRGSPWDAEPSTGTRGVLAAHSRGIPPPGFRGSVSAYGHLGADATARCEGCAAAVGRARLPSCGPRARARLNDRMRSLQGLELLVTVLLARNRQPPPPTVAAGAPHDQLAAELITLPSGLLAMVCEAIVALKVRLAAAGARG